MNETRWTPEQFQDGPAIGVYDADGKPVAQVGGASVAQRVERARLIAAAPELYKALEQFAAVARPHPHIDGQYLILTAHLDRALNGARAALSRARGEEPTE